MSDTGDALRKIAAELEELGYTAEAETLMQEAEAIDPTPVPTFAEKLANALCEDDESSDAYETIDDMYLRNANMAIDMVLAQIKNCESYGDCVIALLS